jgi:hypothetical protein
LPRLGADTEGAPVPSFGEVVRPVEPMPELPRPSGSPSRAIEETPLDLGPAVLEPPPFESVGIPELRLIDRLGV